MIAPIPALLSWSRRHGTLVAAGALLLAAAAALSSTRLTFDTDVLSLLPRDGRVVPAFRTFLERFGSLDELYVVFTAPEGHSIDEYGDAIEAWVDRLRHAPEISRVDTGLADPSRNLQWLADRELLLMPDGALGTALDRLRGSRMRAALAARRDLLALPSPELTEIVRQDPLGLYDLLRDALGGANTGVNLGVAEGGYVTPDSRSRMVIAHPARPPFDTDFSRRLASRLDEIASAMAPGAGTGPEAPVRVEFAGGHRIAVETEAVIRRESVLNTAGSLALILPLLFVLFRSLWLVLVGPLPSGISLVIVLGMFGLAGATLSAAATASAAMLFGLGVDGVVLLYVAHSLAARDGLPPDAAIDRLSGPASSMLLGMWTTAATFYGLTFVDFPSLQQLGALIGHSMVLCGVLTLLLVPALLPRRPGAAAARHPLTMPGLARWVHARRKGILRAAALVTIVLGAAAMFVRVNPTLDRLRSVTPGAVLLQDIGRRFGLPEDVYVILQRGDALEPLLVGNEDLARTIRERLPGVPLQPATALLPSSAAQARRSAAVARAGVSPASTAAALAAAAESEGFRKDTFAPFVERLPRLIAAGQRLSYDGYRENGLGDLIARFVARDYQGWLLVSYVFPAGEQAVSDLQTIVAGAARGTTLTGLPLVNRELADRFVPQFAKGLAIGTLVVVALIVAALRDWRLSLLSLAPAAIGLVWAAGLLALARIELDLFAVFAVVTFVGIGVDYGVHLVHRYQERGHARHAIEELAPVILIAGAITLLGYGTLVTSSYPPLRSIGVVSIVTVVTLSAASIVVLPALLAGRPERAARDSGTA